MPKQKTPIALAIEKIRAELEKPHGLVFRIGLNHAISTLEKLKEKEKEQLTSAFIHGNEYITQNYTQE